MSTREQFEFLDLGPMQDRELILILEDCYPGDPAIGHVPEYHFRLTVDGADCKIGYISLRVGITKDLLLYSGQIGYGVDPGYRGKKYSLRACRLILPLAWEHGMEEVWITCDPTNRASQRICGLLGAEFVETVALAEYTDQYRAGDRYRHRYRIVPDVL